MKPVNSRYKRYFYLLSGQETDIPPEVKKTINFFSAKKLWFNLSRNLESRSCRDAANKRNRLGHIGIPLEHELKSFFGKFTNATGKEQYVVLHCKGNQELDFEKVHKVLHSQNETQRLTLEELGDIFKMEYGLVNPFNLDPRFLKTDVLQVFDSSLRENHRPPYTMMTNAGDVTWAIEFKAHELIDAVEHHTVEDIIQKDNSSKQTPLRQKIGIVTGNGPESGILLWQKINGLIRQKMPPDFYGDISFPYIMVESIPDLGLSMELDLREQETWQALKTAVISLCQRGAAIICIACNTNQYFTPQIRKLTSEYKARFISIPEVVYKYIKKNQLKEFAFLGVKYVTGLDKKWSAFKDLKKFQVETLSEEVLQMIHELAFKVKQEGITGAGINKLRDLLNSVTQSKDIIIALTELSLLLENQKSKSKSGRNYIDTLELLAEAVADEYLRLTQDLYP